MSESRFVKLDGGEIGWNCETIDDCLRPCIATIVGVPLDEMSNPQPITRFMLATYSVLVPKGVAIIDITEAGAKGEWARLENWLSRAGVSMHDLVDQVSDAVWSEVDSWLDDRGLTLRAHPIDALPVDHRRWIGVTSSKSSFSDHCLVMCKGTVLHDPGVGVPAPSGTRLRRWHLADLGYGLTIEQKGTQCLKTSMSEA